MTNYIKPPLPANESERLETLASYHILDTPAEPVFDDLTKLAAFICQTPIALISIVDENRQWFKSRVGIEAVETEREIAFCAHAILEPGKVLVVPDALADARFAENPLVESAPGIRFYAGTPLITPENHALGTLCVIDLVPRKLSPEQLAALQILSREVTTQLIMHRNQAHERKINLALQAAAAENRRTEDALRRESELLQALLDNIPDAIYFKDRDSRFLRVSRHVHLRGINSPEEAYGKTDFDFFTTEHARQAFEDEQEIIKTGVPIIDQLEKETFADNSIGYVLSTKVPTYDSSGEITGIVGVSRDVSARIKAEEALRQSEEKYRTIIETIEEGYFETDLSGNLTFFNDSLRDTLGYDTNELSGINYRRYVENENAVKLSAAFRRIFATGQTVKQLDWEIIRQDGTPRFVESSVSLLRNSAGKPSGFRGLVRDVTDRKNTESELQRLALVARKTQNAVVITDAAGYIEWVNEGFNRITGYTLDEVRGKNPGQLLQGENTNPQTVQKIREAIRAASSFEGEIFNYNKHGKGYWLSMSVTPIFDEANVHQGFIAIEMDITTRKHAEETLFQKEQQLLQAHKMEAIGQLAAGIAHEINTPTQYVGDNTRFLSESFESLTEVLKKHEKLLAACQTNFVTDELIAEVNAARLEIDVEFLIEEAPRAIQQSLDGIEHISKIVGSMKEFAHPGSAEKTESDIHRAIESTVTVASNEWKYVADIELNFDENLRSVPVILREFNQVILNLLVNAAHSIGDAIKVNKQGKGTIKISTKRDDEWAEIRVADSGMGIPLHARAKIFDPFFTTKEVGRGTGQGLAISHSVIVDKHQGTIGFETDEGSGTTFVIRLPLNRISATALAE